MMFTETCKSQSDFKPLKRQKNKMILNLLKFKKVVVLKIYIGMKKPPSSEGGVLKLRDQELKRLFQNCLLTCLPRSAMDSVRGIDFGQASTQF